MDFDAQRARFSGPDQCPRFRVTGEGTVLESAGLSPNTLLLVFERGGEQEQIFLPMSSLESGLDLTFEGKALHAALDPDSGIPFAEDSKGWRPLQLWSRWYGFSASHPGCRVG